MLSVTEPRSAGDSIAMPEELRLVLVGNNGSGKSASGNTILGREQFLSKSSASSVTSTCEQQSAELVLDGGQKKLKVAVADLPGFGDTHLTQDQMFTEIAECLALSAPGPHAFLLVLPIGRFTDEQNQAASNVAKIFGEQAVTKHTVVLFTRGDELEGMSIKEYLRDAPADLKDLITKCGNRYHVFNNKDPSNVAQVEELLMKVMEMVKQTETGFYTNAMFDKVEAIIREEEREIMRNQAEEGSLASGLSLSPSSSRKMATSLTKVMEKIKSVVICGALRFLLGMVYGLHLTAGSCPATRVLGGVVGGVAGVLCDPDVDSPMDAVKQVAKVRETVVEIALKANVAGSADLLGKASGTAVVPSVGVFTAPAAQTSAQKKKKNNNTEKTHGDKKYI